LLVRDVAYSGIPRAERADKHRRAAEWIESLGRPEDHAEMLAHHYLQALELTRAAGREDGALVERARVVSREAGDRALALNAFPAAARFYSHSLALSRPDDPDQPELLFRLGKALHQTGDDRAEQLLEEASRELAAAGRPERAAESHVLLSELWWDRGQRDPSFQQLETARELLGTDESAARAHVLARLARSHMLADDHEEAIRAGREALAIADRLGLDDVRAHALNSVGSARFQLGDPGGIADSESSVEIALAAGSHLAANSYNNLGYMHFLAGDVRRDRELREEGRRLAARFGDERMLRFFRGVIPNYDFSGGDWQEALRQADAFITECEAAPHYVEITVRSLRALMRLAQGDSEGSAADALRAEQLAREAKDPQQLLAALGTRLRVEFELGRLDAAAALAAELLGILPRGASFPPAIELAWAAERLEIVDAVRQWIEAIVVRSVWNDAALAVLDGELECAAALFEEIGSLPDEARARLCAGDPDNVGKALAFYRSVGATRYIREGEGLLAASA
jgi:tetratricopeptide (TPR) repeat protein